MKWCDGGENMTSEDLPHGELDPRMSAEQLQAIAAEYPESRAAIASHPNAYPDLLTWLGSLGDPAVDAALAARAGVPSPQVQSQSQGQPYVPVQEAPSQPYTPQSSEPQPPRSRPRWLIPAAASVAALAVAGAAAAIVLPRLSPNDSAATSGGTSSDGSTAATDDGAASASPAADAPPPTFQDGAAVAWEVNASELVHDPEAVFMWPEVWDDIIPEFWTKPLDLGDQWLVGIALRATDGQAAVAIDKVTGEKVWEHRSPNIADCVSPAAGVAACVDVGMGSSAVTFYESATGQTLASTQLGYMARVVAAGEGLVVTTSADGGVESVAADGINTTIFGASGAITSEVAVPNLADTYFQGVQFADDLIVMGSAEMWVALRPSGEIVAQDAGYPTPISTDRISVVTDMPVQPGVGGLTVENGGSDTWFRSVDLASGKRWYSISGGAGALRDVQGGTEFGANLPMGWSGGTLRAITVDGVERVAVSAALDNYQGNTSLVTTFLPDGSDIQSHEVTYGYSIGVVDGDVALFQPSSNGYSVGGPITGYSLSSNEKLWTLDQPEGVSPFDTPGSGALIAVNWPEDYSGATTIYGILPAESAGPTYETVAAPSGIPACPDETILLAWAQLDNGWVLVCGISAEQPTVFIVGGEVSGGGSTAQVEGAEVIYNAEAGRYTAVLEDGRRAWLEHSPSVLGIKDSAGATTSQASVLRIFFVTLGESGEAQGVGAYEVKAPEHTAADQVRYFSEILASSASARSTLGPAVGAVRDCASMSGFVDEIATITAVRDNRAELLLAIEAAPVDLVPEGAMLVTELTTALTASYNADVAYLTWAQAVQFNGCGSGSEADGVEYSRQAGLAKDAFSARWNTVIAPAFGVATVSRDSL